MCNYKVERNNVPIEEHDSDGNFVGTVRNGIEARRIGGCTEGGDSGGPVFTIEPDGYVIAKGITSGGKGWGPICSLNYSDIQDARRAFGGDVMKRR